MDTLFPVIKSSILLSFGSNMLEAAVSQCPELSTGCPLGGGGGVCPSVECLRVP